MLERKSFGLFGRRYRHVKRYRQILGVIIKYGLANFLDTHRFEQIFEAGFTLIFKKRRREYKILSPAESIRMAFEELGPTFIKFGQLLSTRSDMIPADYIAELEKLQDEITPFSWDEVDEIFRADTGSRPEDIFLTFDKEPFAAASIGQVHRAVLKDGTEVAVKVQRPGIRSVIEVDLEILLHITRMNEKRIEDLGIAKPVKIVYEFARRLEKEIDYTVEALSIERFSRMFKGDDTVHIPRVMRDYTTRRILVMEYLHGVKATEIERLRDGDYDCGEIARRGARLIMKQVFVHGFFHADPHPGNILIMPGNVICYLDFGAMGRISRQEQDDLTELIMHVIKRDDEKAARSLLKFLLYQHEPDMRELREDVADIIDEYLDLSMGDIDIGRLVRQLLAMFRRHNLSLKPHHFQMLMAISTMDTLGRKLDPDFQIVGYAEPFVRQIRLNRLNPKNAVEEILASGTELACLLKDLPGETRTLLRLVRDGRLRFEFHHRGLDPMLETHDQISNRITFAIVLASLIIGSSLIVLSNIPPKWHEIPVIGLGGFVIAGIMGFWLLAAIIRHRRM